MFNFPVLRPWRALPFLAPLLVCAAAAVLAPGGAAAQLTCPGIESGPSSPTVDRGDAALTGQADCDGTDPPAGTRTAPLVSTAPHHPAHVNAAAGATGVSYTTPAYTSLDEERSLTLLYSSGTAAPTVLVQVDAADDGSSEPPSRMSLRVRSSQTGAWQTFTSGLSEHVYSAGNGFSRLAAQWDASGLASGSHLYEVLVRSYWSDGTWTEAPPVSVRVLVVNHRDSPYGSGWTVAGLAWVKPEAGGVYLAEGDGSARWFAYPGTCVQGSVPEYCSYTSPEGDFTRLARHSTTGAWLRYFPDGSKVAFAASGRMSVSVEGRDSTRFAYDAQGRLSTVTDPAGLVTQLGYDAAGRLAWVRDPSGRTVTTRVTSGLLDRICDPVSCAFAGGYDTSRRLTWRTDRAGARWDFQYDAFGRLKQVVAPAVAADGGGTVRPTSSFHTLHAAVLPAPGTGSAASPAARVLPTQVRLTATDALGNAASFAVDRFGNPTSITEPLGRTTYITRDQHGRTTRFQAFQGDVTEYTYQGALLATVRDVASNVTTTYTWTPYIGFPSELHPIGTYLGYPLEIRAPGEPTVRYVQPSWTPRLEQAGSARYWHEEDWYGRPAEVYGPGGHTRYFYAVAGARNVDSVWVVSGTDTVTTRFSRDAVGRVVGTSSAGRSSSAVYDALNRVQSTTTAGATTTYGYAPAGWLQTVTDPKGQQYSYQRNALGWLEAETDPRGAVMRLTYDRVGRPVSGTNRRGQTVRYRYDALGRMLDQTSHEGGVTTYAYDPNGRWMAVTNAESSDTVRTVRGSAPSVDQVTVRGGVRYSLNTRRDTTGHFARVSTSWGYGATHFHLADHSGRLQELRDDRIGLSTRVVRDDSANTTSFVLPMGDSIVRGPKEVRYSDPTAGAALRRTYLYDALRRVAHRGTSMSDWEVFTYDAHDRLAENTVVEGFFETSSTSFTFDAAGNPTHGGSVVTTGNRLEAFAGLGPLTYDADGNLTRRMGPGHDWSFSWNSLGQLTGASGTSDGGATWRTLSFGYDGMGRRVRKTVDGVVTRYLYDGHHVVAETDGAGVVKREYTYYPGVDQPHSMRTGGQTFYYVSDAQGNVTGLVNAAGALVNRYVYTPFGAPALVSEQVFNPLRFAGRELDVETGLYFNRLRYYDPRLQRFISEDPSGLLGGANPYVYAGNDPVNSADPTGLFPCASWEIWQNGRCVQNSVILLPGVSTGGMATGVVGALLRWLDERRATSIDPADEAAYWAALHAQGEAEQWEMQRREGIEAAVRSVREAADLGIGFTPGVSTVHDAWVLLTGYNPVKNESVGLGGRGIAFVGMVVPGVSGGQIRAGGKLIGKGFRAVVGNGYPVKLNRGGRLQPYDAGGRFLPYSANVGLLDRAAARVMTSRSGRAVLGAGEGYLFQKAGSMDLPVASTTAQQVGQAIGSILGSIF
jgi:RHS repeat-associated protein